MYVQKSSLSAREKMWRAIVSNVLVVCRALCFFPLRSFCCTHAPITPAAIKSAVIHFQQIMNQLTNVQLFIATQFSFFVRCCDCHRKTHTIYMYVLFPKHKQAMTLIGQLFNGVSCEWQNRKLYFELVSTTTTATTLTTVAATVQLNSRVVEFNVLCNWKSRF